MKKILLVALALIIIALGIQLLLLKGSREEPLRQNRLKTDVTYSDTPTLLIPGWGGNAWTYSHLIDYYQKQNLAQKTMTIHVTPTGKVHVQGAVMNKKNSLIQVLFDWNYTKNYLPQTAWLSSVLRVLHKNYGINQLNVIAHSWGGTAFVHALANSSYLQKNINFKKIILLGVPINEGFSSKTSYNQALTQKTSDHNYLRLAKKLDKFNPHNLIHFYNLMGSKDGQKKTDGEVPNVQSEFLKTVIHSNWSTYSQKVYKDTNHTDLHQNKEILNHMAAILWQ
ncbi:alpha/beta hydrolase [Ligilactobacillus equi]|nr:alpha/beta hydrolase [Ligilactobacillus equi]